MDRAHVLASGHMDRHAAYVGLTRHRDAVALHYGRDEFADAAALARTLGRQRAKDTSLDYGAEAERDGDRELDRDGDELARRYAERRGLAPESQIVVRPEPLAEHQVKHPLNRHAQPPRVGPSPQAIAAGRAGFRERFDTHRRQQAAARDEAAARDLVDRWDRARDGYHAALPALEADPALKADPTLGGARKDMRQVARDLKDQPAAAQLLRERGEAFGVDLRPTLARLLADPHPERLIVEMMRATEDKTRWQRKEAAEQEAGRQRELEAKRRELDAKQRPAPDRGMSPGW